ncbi:hypothetical protein P872_06000 [Rhodonellum psychrophilum GCM71 = DSM 17998]|uniref:YgjP-like metallopeptidase domain-containing protein n=2 Tax=Rhodonellum TaxID=336827 RepID=U5BZN2_9BACT|nr:MULTISPECIES: SprT family zinc-dependent metalloprotease [Rhodonellum]ERM83024.1 hypothetical protein P872_06000 [Rhodonellum psychrophilum GCM71 = DSM 17998]SDZ47709.1 hypothetical protein SAMN05444412_11670 [Rhodonellum ikkaensis]
MSKVKEERIFTFGSREITYELIYKDRKSLGIRVYPDCKVQVIAPSQTSESTLAIKLKSKAPWILKQQNEFLSYHPLTPPRRYVNGETHLYLGRQYRLTITTEEEEKEDVVKLKRGRMVIYTSNQTKDHLEVILEKWYRIKAQEWFEKLLPICQEKFSQKHQLAISNCKLSLHKMATRWGSCTPKGKIILNPELIKAPKGSIEYVIIHELCHLIHHNHTKTFYELQDIIMPDWKKWKERLERELV